MRLEESIIIGRNAVLEAFRSGKTIDRLFVLTGCEDGPVKSILREAKKTDAVVSFVNGQKLDQLANSTKHQGVVAYIAQVDYVSFEEMVENALNHKAAPLFIMLDGVSDVRNLGAVARTAECAGFDGIILPAKGGAPINADAIKTSAGALLRIPVAKVQNLRMPIFYLLESGFQMVAATEKGADYIYDVNLKKPTAIVMGSEGHGISKSVLDLCDIQAKIPMAGAIGSLNVSVAAALFMYEAVRQRESR